MVMLVYQRGRFKVSRSASLVLGLCPRYFSDGWTSIHMLKLEGPQLHTTAHLVAQLGHLDDSWNFRKWLGTASQPLLPRHSKCPLPTKNWQSTTVVRAWQMSHLNITQILGISFPTNTWKWCSNSPKVGHLPNPGCRVTYPMFIGQWRVFFQCGAREISVEVQKNRSNCIYFTILYKYSISGWWFGTFFIFPYIGNNHPNWLIFFRGVQTTNQI